LFANFSSVWSCYSQKRCVALFTFGLNL
jgi:hypothetical protein